MAEDSKTDHRITSAELVGMFGLDMPAEAFELLFKKSNDMTHDQVREELKRIVRTRAAPVSASMGEATVRQLEWYPDPGAFPHNTWGAQSSFGRFIIEEVSASDSPAYEVRYTPHHLVAVKDCLETAFAAGQADFERRALATLATPRPSELVAALRVKALEWHDRHDKPLRPNDLLAESVIGQYAIRPSSDGTSFRLFCPGVPYNDARVFGDVELAKDAGQNHFEGRISSALNIKGQATGVDDRLRAAFLEGHSAGQGDISENGEACWQRSKTRSAAAAYTGAA